jgi:hypothetical protein
VAQDTGHSDHIIRSVTAVGPRTRRALSPWVQRCLEAEYETVGCGRRGARPLVGLPLRLLTWRPERTRRHRRHRQSAFTAANPRSLVGRVQRVVERGTVWRPDVGSLKPAMVARFADAIVDRFPSIGAKYQPRPSGDEGTQRPELPLVSGLMPDLAAAPSMGRTARPASWPTTLPPLPRQAAPTVQRTVKPPTTSPRRARLFSWVEEIPAEGEIPTGDESPEEEIPTGDKPPAGQPTQVEPAQVERAPDTTTMLPVQRQSDREMPDQAPLRPAPRRGQPAELPRTERILARAASRRRLPLTKPSPLTPQKATAHLVTRGWRFKRKESSVPAAPDLVARAVDDLERPTSPGQPLEHKPRGMMERVMGRDFGDVRIHTARLAPLNVQAATRGQDVYVEPGQDRFDTPESLSLLGHELTHVAQGAGIVSTKPVAQTAILPQAQAPVHLELEGEEAKAESSEQTILDLFRPATVQRAEAAGEGVSPSLPVSPTGRPASAERVQRQPVTSPMDTWEGEEELVEAAGEEEGLPEAEEMEDVEGYLPTEEEEEEELEEEKPEEKPDLDRLARQVYPFIKRLLAVERERMAR